MKLHLFRDILDKQLVDQAECRMGRVDGLIGRVRSDGPPVIECMEVGMATLVRRLHPRLGDWAVALSKRLGVRATPHYRIEWSRVKSVDSHQIQVMVDTEREPSNDWEWWLRTHVVDKIPGGKPERDQK
jgi:hypothetical protein